MDRTILVTFAATLLSAGPCLALDWRGGEVALAFGAYDDSVGIGYSDMSATGRLDLGISERFGAQVNLGFGQLRAAEADFTADNPLVGLHLYTTLPSGNRLGAFAQRRSINNSLDIDSFGIEAMLLADRAGIEVYGGLGTTSAGSDSTVVTFGLRGDYDFSDRFGAYFSADYDKVSIGGNYTSYAVYRAGLDHRVNLGFSATPFTLAVEMRHLTQGVAHYDGAAVLVKVPLGGAEPRPMFGDRGGYIQNMGILF